MGISLNMEVERESGMQHLAEHNLVATYPDARAARAAVLALERRGMEATDIELLGPNARHASVPVTNDEQRSLDMNVTGAVARRSAAGAMIGTVFGATVAASIAAVVSGDSGPILVAAGGGLMVGGILGFLYAMYSGLPVSEQFEETFAETAGATTVAVHSPDPHQIERAVAALRGTHAIRIATCGRDGALRHVA